MTRVTTLAAGTVVVLAAVVVTAIVTTRRSSEHAASCHAEVTELREWMTQLDAEGGGAGKAALPGGVDLVALDEPAGGGEDGPILTLAGNTLMLDGRPTGTLEDPDAAAKELREALRAQGVLWLQTHPGKRYPEPPMTLAIGQTTPWSKVTSLLYVATRAGARQAWFAFDGVSRLTAPRETDVSRELRKWASGEVDPSQKARIAEERVSRVPRVYSHCQPVVDALGQLGETSADVEQKNAAFLRAVPDGIEQCGCDVDLDEVKAVQWARYGRYDGPLQAFRQLSVTLPGDSEATALTAPPGEPWSQAYTRVLAASKRGAKVFFASQ